MGVIRIGHIHLRELDLDAAVHHYETVLGLTVTHRDGDGVVYLKAWDEWDKYSIALVEADEAGMDHVAYKVAAGSDLDDIAAKAEAFGVHVTELAPGELHAVGRALRFQLPSHQSMVVYADKEFVGTETGFLNPEPWPEGAKGAAVKWLDHCLLMAELNPEEGVNTVAESARFMQEVLGFRLVEQLVGGPDGGMQMAAFLSCTTTPHDIAFVGAPTSGFHHAGFFVESWEDVLRAADVLARHKVRVDVTPQRHGITRGYTTYFFDPSGNRNEVFGGLGYLATSDRPVMTWTEDQIGPAVFYHTGELVPSFIGVYT